MRIIGLHGKAQSGKDTTFEFIQDWANSQDLLAERDAFADRLKISAARALGFQGPNYECIHFCNDLKYAATIDIKWNQEALDASPSVTDSWSGWSLSGREFLQLYGTEAHREVFDPDFWISQVIDIDRGILDLLVITDVRFPNEAEAIKAEGGQIWHILRDGAGAGDHASEQALDPDLIDCFIHNDGTLEELEDTVRGILEFQKDLESLT